jgi:DNA polymerase elongation subunit (family B)
MTSCVLEYELDHIDDRTSQPNIKPLPENEWAAMPTRLHVASLDIECAGRRGIFPDPLIDPIIQIGTLVMLHGAAPNTPPLSFTIYTWRTASTPVCGYYEAGGYRAEYVVCRDESDMIAKWVKLMRELRVDLYTGWNTDDFDLPYIVRRAGALTPQPDLCGLGRRLGARIVAKPTKFSSKQLGTRESYSLEGIEGVHFLDMCIEVMRSRKERSYKLDYISRVVLAHKNIYELSLVESLWLKEVRSVQILGLGSKKCDWLESPLLFASGRLVDVVDRSTHPTLPLVAGDYRLVLSRPQKEQRLFMRFFNEAGRCIGRPRAAKRLGW